MTQSPVRVDWFRVIVDLGRERMSYRDIAGEVGVAKTTVYRWAVGAEPLHSHGNALLNLWALKLQREINDVPLVIPGDWRSYHAR